MPFRDPRRLAPWAAGAVLLVLLAVFYLQRSRAPDAAAAPIATIAVSGEDDTGGGGGGRILVDVAGAGHKPSGYPLASGSRVEDALHRAGGATSHADLSQINRAAKLEDGRQVLVPVRVRAG